MLASDQYYTSDQARRLQHHYWMARGVRLRVDPGLPRTEVVVDERRRTVWVGLGLSDSQLHQALARGTVYIHYPEQVTAACSPRDAVVIPLRSHQTAKESGKKSAAWVGRP